MTALARVRQPRGSKVKASPAIALKVMDMSSIKSASREVTVHQTLDEAHPGRRYVIRLLESFLIQDRPCLAFEAHGSELAALLRKQGPLSLAQVKRLTKQLLLGLQALHDAGFAHGDMKPENVLWDADSEQARLIDLGWARRGYDRGQAIATRDYCPPEMLLGIEMSAAIDLWGLGCSVFEALTGELLFDPYALCEKKYAEFDPNWNAAETDGDGEVTDEVEPKPLALEADSVIGDKYRLHRKLGGGKSGDVWLASATHSDVVDLPSLQPLALDAFCSPPRQDDSRPAKLDIWEVVIAYEHLLHMQQHLGTIPTSLARRGRFFYIFFNEDGSMRFDQTIEHRPIKDRLMAKAGLDEASASAVEEFLCHIMNVDASVRWTAAQALQHPWLLA